VRRFPLLLSLCVAACRTASTPTAPATPSVAHPMPDSLHWVRNSAEYQAATRQTYRLAALTLERRAAGKPNGAWAVILDADETILDNSEYMKERFAVGSKFTAPTWDEWTRRKSAGTVPGALEFLTRIRELGGRVAIVTNRTQNECADTETNLKSNGLPYDVILCNAEPRGSSKQARFEEVAAGTTPAGLPPLEVLMWVGDNILDFPGLDQDARSQRERLNDFGERFFVLPNPSYGSWEDRPRL
jgi:acid phosphatase